MSLINKLSSRFESPAVGWASLSILIYLYINLEGGKTVPEQVPVRDSAKTTIITHSKFLFCNQCASSDICLS